ncbi:hypothetical protein EDB83DRAFT_2639748 [Lactarius deliciosus]|nr:hypothetical protein EDB83DRAFT_2639748 [Lactarius deliciosus]
MDRRFRRRRDLGRVLLRLPGHDRRYQGRYDGCGLLQVMLSKKGKVRKRSIIGQPVTEILQIYRFGSSGVILTLADLQLTLGGPWPEVIPGPIQVIPHIRHVRVIYKVKVIKGVRRGLGTVLHPSATVVVAAAARAARLACVGLPAVVALVAHKGRVQENVLTTYWFIDVALPGPVASTKDGGARTAGDHPPYTDQHAPAGTRSQDIVDAGPTNKPKKMSITAPGPAPHVPSATPRRPTSTHSHHRWESNASQPSSACRGGGDDDPAARPNHNGSGGGVLCSLKCPCCAPTTTVADGWSTVRQGKFHAALL